MKIIIIVSFLFSTIFAIAQEATIEKNISGIQLGLLNISVQNETRLARKIALRTEAGLELGFVTTKSTNPFVNDKTYTVLIPYVSLEPKWYYNIDKRAKLGRNIKNNSGNFLSLNTTYLSTETPIINSKNVNVVPAILVVPKFGIRRAFAKNFNYEFSFGLRFQNNLIRNGQPCNCSSSETGLDIQARIGYNF